ncbi:MAG TPA: glutathione peroxidase [Rhizomicrobium sp.]|jgi:glutathione peroxidase|nr:glutathione peroxidase [Rhizomicrobium sp.]
MSKTAYDFTFKSIDGADLPLSTFKGKALLVVNVASQCGLTPQYSGLEELWKARRDDGLVILGVPANDFGAQEPGTEDQIKTFCETRFAVDFPMTAKEHVIGAQAHPLYKWVESELGEAAAPKWNFHKYLFNRDGSIAGTFGSRTEPNDAQMGKAIDAALG